MPRQYPQIKSGGRWEMKTILKTRIFVLSPDEFLLGAGIILSSGVLVLISVAALTQ